MIYFNQKNQNGSSSEVSNLAANQEPTISSTVQSAQELLALYDSTRQINFEKTNELALECAEEILEHWLPDGELTGQEYKALNPIRNDNSIGSFSINVVKGVWADFSMDDRGADLISLIAYLEDGITQPAAAKKILEFIAGMPTEYGAKRSEVGKNAEAPPEFTPIMPVPKDAKLRTKYFGPNLGSPTSTWDYKDASGNLLCSVHRFDPVTGKFYTPETYCQNSTGHMQWKLQGPPIPRPAYGLDLLAARPDAPVLFTEGEKAADAAQRLFPHFVAVTTMNGAKSPEKTDFSPFQGRKVYIAPDNDEAGFAYKDRLIVLLQGVGAEVVGVMRIELLARDGISLAQGDDLADAETNGWTVEALAALGDDLWEKLPIPTKSNIEKVELPAAIKDKESDGKKEPILVTTRKFSAEKYDHKLAFTNSQFRAYKDGYWPSLDEAVHVRRPILEFLGEKATPNFINSIVSMLAAAYAALPENFERHTPLICLNNGTLNPITSELEPHDPDHYLTNKLEVEWDGSATAPIWLQTLGEIFLPDADKAEKIQLLQEFFGYCLVPMTEMHKFLWMVGGGGNGKSLVLNVLTTLIGRANISFAQVERLQDKFVRAELSGKLVNISSEMSAGATIADGYLKQIVAGDVIEAERKHQPSFSFKPYSRMIGATNELPRLLDHSDGFFRRAMILRFNRQFTEAEQDKGREGKLQVEMPGILRWAVEGLQRLLQRGHFLIPSSSHIEVNKYRVNSDPLRQFAEECLESSNHRPDFITPITLHAAYQAWSKAYGYQAVSVAKLTDRLKGIGFDQFRSGGARLWKLKYSEPLDYCLGDSQTDRPVTSAIAAKYVV